MASTFRLKRKMFGGGFNADTYRGMLSNVNSTPDGQKVLNAYSKKYANEVANYRQNTAVATVSKPATTAVSATPKPATITTPNSGNTGGIMSKMKGQWNKMGKMGKAGTVAAAAGATYLLGKGLFGGKKDK